MKTLFKEKGLPIISTYDCMEDLIDLVSDYTNELGKGIPNENLYEAFSGVFLTVEKYYRQLYLDLENYQQASDEEKELIDVALMLSILNYNLNPDEKSTLKGEEIEIRKVSNLTKSLLKGSQYLLDFFYRYSDEFLSGEDYDIECFKEAYEELYDEFFFDKEKPNKLSDVLGFDFIYMIDNPDNEGDEEDDDSYEDDDINFVGLNTGFGQQ